MAQAGERIEFHGGGDFFAEMKRRVNAYLAEPGRARRVQARMYLKTAIILSWFAASWVLLMFFAQNWWQVGLLAVSLGLSLAGAGFNVHHDANHGSLSSSRKVNRVLGWTMDLMGLSSHVWRVKHNVAHHTYTNISGADSDIEQLPLARLAPDQPHKPYHRFQHVYLWVLYGLFSIKMQFGSDIALLVRGQVGETRLRWPRGVELAAMIVGKAFFLTWAVVIPLIVHPIWVWAVVALVVSWVLAVTLAVVFQLAHCVSEAEFKTAPVMKASGRTEWARHQVETTVDFCRGNPIATWYLGGLNYQVEHHLFSKVCHMHYPGIAPIVEQVCKEYGIRYRAFPSFFSALVSHARWLRSMGQAPATAPAQG